MPYEFKTGETIPKAIKRMAQAQLDDILADLTGQPATPSAMLVHDLRRRLRRVRAILRLVRDVLKARTYRKEKGSLRDLARTVSGVRDAEAVVIAFDKLTQHFSPEVKLEGLLPLREALTARCQTIRKQVIDESDVLVKIGAAVREVRKRVKNWSRIPDDWCTLHDGFKQTYAQARAALACVLEKPSQANLHYLRRRAKEHRFQLQILHPLRPDLMDVLETQVHQLVDYLGDDHDLALLHQAIVDDPRNLDKPRFLKVLTPLIGQRRVELLNMAQFLGRWIFAEKPKAFAARMCAYWQVWISQPVPPLAEAPS